MPLAPGTRLGPYEILGPLGAGGMGEVHRARDTRLGREVAIKVLSTRLASNPELRARFEREAKTISSLNHPHICTLFDVGRAPGEAGSDDTDFLVMELVEGESLADRTARGPLPVAEVLKIGAQVADALDRAHRAGVVHRDLKPGNIMLTRSGAKLMDFGLARATGLAGPPSGSAATLAALTHSPTRAQPLTAEGTLVGTFQYMPPEQLEGKDVDGRSDLWALGCVLYEMATGRRAFEGLSQASLISSIMKEDPAPISQIAPMSPPALERLVRQCLAKNPDDRWQSAGDVKRELEWIAGGSQSGSVTGASAVKPQPAPHASNRVAIIAAGAVVLAAMAYLLGPWKPSRSAAPAMVRFTMSAPPGITLSAPAEAEISPDGRSLVFVGFDSTGTERLYLRPLSSPEARVLPGTDGGGTPFWSPDSRAIGFFSSGKLRKVALDGSPPVVLCDAPDARGGSWSPRGVIAFVPNNASPVWRVPASGGAAVQVTKLDAKLGERGHRYPQFLPDGRHFLFVGIGQSEERTTFAMPIDGGDPVEVCRASSIARFAAPGHLLFLEGDVTAPQRRLLARRFDPGARKVSGDAVLVLDRVNATNFGYANVTASENGTLVAQHWGQTRARLTWRDRRGASLGVVAEDIEGVEWLSLSPDGRRLAIAGDGGNDLAVFDLESGIKTRLTFENTTVSNMIWSADGRRIVFARLNGSRGWDIRVKAVDEASPESVVFKGPAMLNYPQDWSRDGKWLVARCADSTGNFDLWKIPMDGNGAPEPYLRTAANEFGPSLSRDGRWISYSITENGQQSTFVQAFPNPGAKYQVAVKAPNYIGWSLREDALLAGIETDVYRIAVSTEGGFRQGATTPWMRVPPNEFVVGLAPDEQRVLVGEMKDTRSVTQLEVVLNWRELLERR